MNKIKAFVPIVISTIFIYLAFSHISLSSVVSSFSKIKWHWIFISFLCCCLGSIVRVIRWKFFFKRPIKFYSLLSSFLIGLMVNNIIPARIGELVRAHILSKRENLSKSLTFGTIVLERIFDGLSVFLFLVILFFICPFPKEVKNIGFITTGSYLIVLVFFFLLRTHKELIVNLAFSKKLSYIISEFSEGLLILDSLKHTSIIILYSIVAWVIIGFSFYFCLLGFSLTLPIYVGFFILVMAVIGVMIPAAPGYLGTYQYFCILGLTIFGVDKNLAFSYSMVAYIISFVPVTIVGIILLFLEGFSFDKILSFKVQGDKEHDSKRREAYRLI